MPGQPEIALSGAKREAVQPSLLDRLWDDLPGLEFEVQSLWQRLIKDLDEDVVDKCVSGGERTIGRVEDLDDDQKRDLKVLSSLVMRQSSLRARGIVVTPDVLREAVRRDIEALFNTERLDAKPLLSDEERRSFGDCAVDLLDFPNVRRSVLNFGMPSFAGRSISDFDFDSLSKEIREVLATFEPRLRKDSIEVGLKRAKGVGLVVSIAGVLQMTPFPERLRLQTSIDLDSGSAKTSLEA
ncbi:MAG: type VI secretion system baseplate subunit TssE [Pseudomonadota bacterium]